MIIPIVRASKPPSDADRLRSLPVVVGALVASVAIANGAALLVIALSAAGPERPTALVIRIALIATAVVLLVLAPAFETLIRSRALPPASPRSPAATYVAAKIAGSALREGAGLLGMVLGLLTGEQLWPALFGALAIASLLLAWPRADERERVARGIAD